MFGKPEPTVQELVTACVVRKQGVEVRFNLSVIRPTFLRPIFHCFVSCCGHLYFDQVTANDLQVLVDEKVSQFSVLG